MDQRMMPEITKTHKGTKLVVEGGWTVTIPSMGVTIAADKALLIGAWGGAGLTPTEAEKAVDITMQDVFWRGWFYHLKWFLIYWMGYYADTYPHLVNQDGTMRGFDPGELVMLWLPKEKEFGKDGKQYIQEVLHDMSTNQSDQIELFGGQR